jgi:hypothetical protein
MSVFKKFTRQLTSVLFSRALGDVFEWGPSVPEAMPRSEMRADTPPPNLATSAPAAWRHAVQHTVAG